MARKKQIEKPDVTFRDYIKAGYPVLWTRTHEEDRVIEAFASQMPNYQAFSWDIIGGLQNIRKGVAVRMDDPIAPLTKIQEMDSQVLFFLKDYHEFIKALEVKRSLRNIVGHLKATNKHLIIVSPILKVPVELEKDVTVVPFALPTVEELKRVADDLVASNGLKCDVPGDVIYASKGLTLPEAENAFSLSLVKSGGFDKDIVERVKLNAVRQSGKMEIYEPVGESELGGLDALKEYVRRRKNAFRNTLNPPKGIIMVGLPGAGKSLAAKVIASMLDVPLLRLDVGALKGSLVGESETNMRDALAMIDAVSPCVVWLDEIEKGLGGVQSSNRTDGGTTSNMFGSLLTWMSESKAPKYIVATCNDIKDLLSISQGALIRAGRFDDVFFVDLPNETERAAIVEIMNRRYGTNFAPEEYAQITDGWTGAEIEKFVSSSRFDGDQDAFNSVRPIFQTNLENLKAARAWAESNARPASVRVSQNPGKARRIDA